ncbi:MAG: hypothetical protein NT126_08975 [Bacteroidetes bacterium]|nr:hypothetical protein [Bacteroidota bacterium]
MKKIWSVAILTLLFFSCKKDHVESPVASGYYGYFPLEQDSWVVYDVDSVVHLTDDDLTNRPDTSIAVYHFQIKEIIDSGFMDGEGNQAFRISRYKRMNDTLPWDFQVEWTAKLTATSAQRVEDNIRYVKLSFPMNKKTSWNGNAYNNYVREDYSYDDIHVPSTINTLYFDSTVTVLQLLDDNLIHRIYKAEKYANHVGLVYKQKDSLNINSIGQVTNGVEFKESILSFGHN